MNRKNLGLVLIILGIAVLVYGGFTYTKKNRELDLGFMSFNIKNREHVDIPPWVGVAGIVAGSILFTRKR